MSTPESGVTVKIPVRWSDMDAYGHINNVQVVRIMEDARVKVFGVPSGTGTPGGPAPIFDMNASVGPTTMTLISDHTVKYRRQMAYTGDDVAVTVAVTKARGASVEISYTMTDPATSQVAVTATSTMVFVDGETGRPLRMTPEQVELFKSIGG